MKRSKKESLTRGRKKRRLQSDELQERVKIGQERSQGRSSNILKESSGITLWRPKDGSHVIDVIPYMVGKYDPLVEKGKWNYTFEYWAHTRVGPNESMYLCPAEMFNKPCPICEDRQRLREKGVEDEVWKKLFPKRRNLYNVVCYDKGEEKKGVQVWDVSYHYFEKFVIAISKKPARRGGEEKSINFANPEDGKSINFTIEPAKSKNDYPTYLGHSFDERDYEIEDDLLDAAFILDQEVHIAGYDEIKKAYWGGKDQDEDKGSRRKRKRKDEKDESENDEGKEEDRSEELETLLEELEDLDEMEEIEDFIEENDLDIKIKRKDDEDDIKEKIIDVLEEKYEEDDIPY